MILTCPACNTSYTVKDGAIPPQGRTVRCAACKHSWHQADDGVAEIGEPPAARTATPTDVPDPISEPSPEPTEHEPEAMPTAVPAPVAAEPEAVPFKEEVTPQPVESVACPIAEPVSDSGWNDAPYSDEEDAPRRKGPLVLLGLLVLVAVLAAAAYFLAPRQWMARAGLAEASAESPLKLMVTSQTRQKLASGNDLVSLSGRVINPTDASEAVPALQADLRDGGGKLVYSWMIPPPAAQLAPRTSASFNAAELGVPANATSLTLRWAS